jgi:4-carboxymuconolactone decarboxylase
MTLSPSKQKLAVLLIAGSAAVIAYAQAKLPADIDPQSRARLPYLTQAEVDEKATPIYNIFKTKDGKLNGPLAFAAYNGGVGKALLDLHDAAVGAKSLDAHTRELAIMVACRETNYNLEWNGHEAAALRAGIDAKVLDIVKTNGALTGLDEKDAAVIKFGRQLYRDKKVDSATFAKVVALWGKRGAMDMVAVMNTYAVSGFFAAAVDEQAAEGKAALPALK